MNPTRKLTRVGASRSLAIVIPAEFIAALGWREKEKVSFQKKNGSIIIRNAKTKKK